MGSIFKKNKTTKNRKIQTIYQRKFTVSKNFYFKKNNDIIGTFSFSETDETNDDNSAFLEFVLISPNFRGKGFGNILLSFIDKTAKQLYKSIFLKTDLNYFYEKIGFTFIKLVKQGETYTKLYYKKYE